MIFDELRMQLHDRYTRGETLTAEEQAQLEAWYREQDAAEAQQLNQAGMTSGVLELHTQVETALAHLASTIQRVQQITTQNEGLRQENLTLRQQLATSKSA
jgi:hypothetical protein